MHTLCYQRQQEEKSSRPISVTNLLTGLASHRYLSEYYLTSVEAISGVNYTAPLCNLLVLPWWYITEKGHGRLYNLSVCLRTLQASGLSFAFYPALAFLSFSALHAATRSVGGPRGESCGQWQGSFRLYRGVSLGRRTYAGSETRRRRRATLSIKSSAPGLSPLGMLLG